MSTPKTDELIAKITADVEGVDWINNPDAGEVLRLIAHARTLERALSAAEAERDKLRMALTKIKLRSFSDAEAEELEDAQRDLRHIHATASDALGARCRTTKRHYFGDPI